MRCNLLSDHGTRCVRPPHDEYLHPDGPTHLDLTGHTWRAHPPVPPAPIRQVGTRQSWADAQATAYGHGRG